MSAFSAVRWFALLVVGSAALLVMSQSSAFAALESDSPAEKLPDQASWFASVAAVYTDNVGLTDTNNRSNLSPKASLGGLFVSNRDRLSTKIDADFSYQAYDNTQRGSGSQSAEQTNGGASLALLGAILPQRFLWRVKDDYGVTPVNLAQADSPYNRQRTNVFETGPVVRLPFGSRSQLELEGSWFTSTFGKSASDSTGEKAIASVVHKTALASALSLNAAQTRIHYKSALNDTNFEVRSAYVRWEKIRGRSSIDLRLGATELRGAGIDQSSPLVEFTFRRKTSLRGSVAVAISREFSSAALAFQGNQSFFGVSRGINNVQVANDPYRSDDVRLSWRTEGDRLQLSTQIDLRRDTYDSNPLLDARLLGAEVYAGRQMSSKIRLFAGGQYRRRQFRSSDSTTTERSISAGIDYSMSPTLYLTLFGRRNNVTDPRNVVSANENLIELRLTYRSARR